ncbi:MAG: alpha-N-acetylglucosaminidase TIM-barrel domain-containing protein, partial [Oscillospiraceae bacterium]
MEAYGIASGHEEPVFELPDSDPNDPNNIAYGKPVRVPMNDYYAWRVNDGNNSTFWGAKYFPSYVDIDLEENYDLSEVDVCAPTGDDRYYEYSIYGSTDGVHFNLLANKNDKTPAQPEGDTIMLDGQTARIVRVLMENNSGDTKALFSEIRVRGVKSSVPVTERPELDIPSFEDTSYAKPVTEQETLEEVYGVISRTIGSEYLDWFTFAIEPNAESDNDYFAISDAADGKIHIVGNEGVSLTMGLNHYLKYYCKVAIQQETMQVRMPAEIVPVGNPIRKESPYKIRYAYNYCTLSYTMPFWGVDEWQRELDWLALNGVNVVLDLTGQEEVWRRFLGELGYTTDEAKDWLAGPVYYAWQFMGNMENFGGPVPDEWIADRVELARGNHRKMAALGMQPVMQGYAGMVPTNFSEKAASEGVEIMQQGSWERLARPSMLRTDSETYDKYAALFYQAQREVYGDISDYYAVDPFHEGGIRPADLSDSIISREVLDSMLKEDPDAVWMIQAWHDNPTDAQLEGLGKYREDHAIILDLTATDQRMRWKPTNEFKGTSWIYCVLDNYGGNPSLHGELTALSEEIPEALAEAKHMKGIGITSEALEHDPVYYELLYEMGWETAPIDLNQWLYDYAERRYGAESEAAENAWKLLSETAYYNTHASHHGDAQTIVVYEPGSCYNGKRYEPLYAPQKLERALRSLLEDYNALSASESYLYDVVDLTRQQISNYQQIIYDEMTDAYDAGNLAGFRQARDRFMESIDVMERILQAVPTRTMDRWVGMAQKASEGYDDFSKRMFEIDSKALLTTWAGHENSWSLGDYAARQFSGLLGGYYAQRWAVWTDMLENSLINGTPYEEISEETYFNIAWDYILGNQGYALENQGVEDPISTIKALSSFVLENYTYYNGPENIALDKPVEASGTEKAEQYQPEKAVDGVVSFASRWSSDRSDNAWITIDLTKPEAINKVVLKWELKAENFIIQVSNDNQNWYTVNEEFRDKPNEGGYAVVYQLSFEPVTARYVRLQVIKRAPGSDGTY